MKDLTCHRVRCNGTLQPTGPQSDYLFQCDGCNREVLAEAPCRDLADRNGGPVAQFSAGLIEIAEDGANV